MTPIGSPRVPSTVGSSLVTPVARDAEPDDSAHAARLPTPAMPASAHHPQPIGLHCHAFQRALLLLLKLRDSCLLRPMFTSLALFLLGGRPGSLGVRAR